MVNHENGELVVRVHELCRRISDLRKWFMWMLGFILVWLAGVSTAYVVLANDNSVLKERTKVPVPPAWEKLINERFDRQAENIKELKGLVREMAEKLHRYAEKRE